jgi:hypothetical protein
MRQFVYVSAKAGLDRSRSQSHGCMSLHTLMLCCASLVEFDHCLDTVKPCYSKYQCTRSCWSAPWTLVQAPLSYRAPGMPVSLAPSLIHTQFPCTCCRLSPSSISDEDARRHLKTSNLEPLGAADQLRQEMAAGRVFQGDWQEAGPLTFPPTFKFKVGSGVAVGSSGVAACL